MRVNLHFFSSFRSHHPADQLVEPERVERRGHRHPNGALTTPALLSPRKFRFRRCEAFGLREAAKNNGLFSGPALPLPPRA